MPLRLVTAPTSEPVTLGEAKNHLRLESEDDNDYIESLIVAARLHVEEACWRGLVTQTWELVLDRFRGVDALELAGGPVSLADNTSWAFPRVSYVRGLDYIELPRGNLSSLTSVKYIDDSGVEQTLASSEYVVDDATVPARLRLAHGKTWPSTRYQWDGVRIRYVVGWAADSVPKPIKQAVLLLVSQLYEHRTPEVLGGAHSKITFGVESLLAPYRLNRVG